MSGHRIVSLLASATETACALGFAGDMVGRSHECDFPEGILGLPVCSRARLDPSAPARDIHDQVQDRLRRALSIYEVDADRVRELAPTVILTQDHCRVCAVSLADVEAAACAYFPSRPAIVSLSPQDLAGVLDGFRAIARALGAPERGEALAASLLARMDAIAGRAGSLAARPRVACLEWLDPPMACGNWMPELVARAGGENPRAAGRHSPWMSFADLAACDPDIVLLLPCGFDRARARREAAPLLRHPGWPALRAVREGRVYVLDGNRYFNRPGPRLAESLEILAEILHPEAFRFGHEGDAWERL